MKPCIEGQRERVRELCRNAALALYGQCPEFTVERPRMGGGDFAASAALALGGTLRRRPSEIAAELAEKIELPEGERVEVGGKGFLNFFLRPDFLTAVLEPVRELPYVPLPELSAPEFAAAHSYHRLRKLLELHGIKPVDKPSLEQLTSPEEVRLLWAIAEEKPAEIIAAAMELYDKLGLSAGDRSKAEARYVLLNNALYLMYRGKEDSYE